MHMVRPRSEKKLTQIPLYLDREVFEAFEDTLPRKKSVSEAIREYMEWQVQDSKNSKAQESSSQS